MFDQQQNRQKTSSKPSPANGAASAYDALFRGPGAEVRVRSLRQGMAQALEAWWRTGQMPVRGLLRDGLLALEAGHDLDDAGRTLLLRAALHYGRGMRTALRHQQDAERTASVMRDLLLNVTRPLNPAQIRQLVTADEADQRWYRSLLQLLREESVTALAPRNTLAQAALRYFETTPAKQVTKWTAPGNMEVAKQPFKPVRRKRRRLPRRQLRTLANVFGLLAVLMIVIAAVLFWQDVRQTQALVDDMEQIPAGVYVIGDPVDRNLERQVELKAFAIDHTEVTNRAYRRCFDAAVCPWPSRVTSITRPDYFLDPTLGAYPMINVTWAEAQTFCTWVGKRLPLAEEWEVAAGSALTLDERFLFPWGNSFDPHLTNNVEASTQDTLPVSNYSPAGDSPSGAADMAGNVAEWTASPAGLQQETPDAYIVKGGSFLSSREELVLSTQQAVEAVTYAPG
ncbi:MAG: SUMF1/EgtB/PvdO family nonheme iron enzyme [Caldilineaceae bacterium]